MTNITETDKRRQRVLQEGVTDFDSAPQAVVYWMTREMRVHDNWSLLTAIEIANQQQVPVVVIYNLKADYLGGGARQYHLKLQGLQSVETGLRKHHIQLLVTTGDDAESEMHALLNKWNVQTVVVDFNPLRIQQEWNAALMKQLPNVSLIEVDAHNIVPVWETSEKQEWAARTIRPKIHKRLPEFLTEFPATHAPKQQRLLADVYPQPKAPHWEALEKAGPKPQEIDAEIAVMGGEVPAHKKLEVFIKRLKGYGIDRNDPTIDGQSDLSPYLHYGMIAPQRVALSVIAEAGVSVERLFDARQNAASREKQSKQMSLADSAAAFLEELIVRRELSDNYCLYQPHYDSFAGFPDWAQQTLNAHRRDTREYLYTLKEFEQGKTHDTAWNAAQLQMVRTGKMHGYMRMYWAKKILEWTKDPEQAQKWAIVLNDRYSLDGRDPNGYVGIAWSIGGVHDRPWFDREVFGTVRFMAESGLKKKFDLEAYVAKWAPSSTNGTLF